MASYKPQNCFPKGRIWILRVLTGIPATARNAKKHGVSIAEIESLLDRLVVILPDKGECSERATISGNRNHIGRSEMRS